MILKHYSNTIHPQVEERMIIHLPIHNPNLTKKRMTNRMQKENLLPNVGTVKSL